MGPSHYTTIYQIPRHKLLLEFQTFLRFLQISWHLLGINYIIHKLNVYCRTVKRQQQIKQDFNVLFFDDFKISAVLTIDKLFTTKLARSLGAEYLWLWFGHRLQSRGRSDSLRRQSPLQSYSWSRGHHLLGGHCNGSKRTAISSSSVSICTCAIQRYQVCNRKGNFAVI